MRIIFVLLLAGCAGAASAPAEERALQAAAEVESTQAAEEESTHAAEEENTAEPAFAGSAEPEPAALTYSLVPPPEAYFFVDPCFASRHATAEGALRECRRLARSGTRYEQRYCGCARRHLVEVRPEDPIAFYRGCCWGPGATPEVARAECERRLAANWCADAEPEVVHAVTGPYERHPRRFREYEAADARFLEASDRNSSWLTETGEPPCFPSGTQIETDAGPVAIEHIKVGDQVFSLRDGEHALVPVLGIKVRRTEYLLVLTLSDGELTVTPDHPIWFAGAWRPAYQIERGDQLTGLSGSLQVLSVRHEVRDVEVRTLRVGTPHSFFAEGVWVHNY